MFDPIFSKILVAFDGSESSKRALDIAAKTVAMFKGELIILTVVPHVSLPILSDEGVPPIRAMDIQDTIIQMRELYRKTLESAVVEVRERYPHLTFEAVFLEGRPSAIIVDEAEKRDVSLIVMGSRGLGGITGWILGSTSRKVVEQCTKPILITKEV